MKVTIVILKENGIKLCQIRTRIKKSSVLILRREREREREREKACVRIVEESY